MKKRKPSEIDVKHVYVKSFFHCGLKRRLFAWQYGKQCFCLRVRKK